MQEKILVTGGAGFLGTNVALKCLESQLVPIVFDNLCRPGVEDNAHMLASMGIEIIRGDVRCQDDFDRLPQVDAIFHLAANPGVPWSFSWPRFDFEINAVGSINVLEYARAHGKIPVVLMASNKVYCEAINSIPVKETPKRYEWEAVKAIDEYGPYDGRGRHGRSPYGCSKAVADLYAQEYWHAYGVPTVSLRASCLYGLFQKGVQDQGWIDWFCRAKRFGYPLTIFGDGKQVRDALWGGDIASLFMMLLENIHRVGGEVFNIGGGVSNTLSLLELIDHLNSKGGDPLTISYAPWRTADQKIYISDISKIKSVIGWEPVTGTWEGIDTLWNSLKSA
jgi:CDP-paratose 2-epimerase